MPTPVAALATVPFSATARVAACTTAPMQQACRDSPLKSASRPNATPMPRPVSSSRRLADELRLTLGSAIAACRAGLDSAVSSRDRVAGGSAGQPPDPEPAAGSRAIIDSSPPRYGSDTAVQPPEALTPNPFPCMSRALTCPPAAVVNGPDLVWLAWNGAAQAASR